MGVQGLKSQLRHHMKYSWVFFLFLAFPFSITAVKTSRTKVLSTGILQKWLLQDCPWPFAGGMDRQSSSPSSSNVILSLIGDTKFWPTPQTYWMSNKEEEQGPGGPCHVLGVLTWDSSRHTDEGWEAVGRERGPEKGGGNLGAPAPAQVGEDEPRARRRPTRKGVKQQEERV